jgi:hypothetical protein
MHVSGPLQDTALSAVPPGVSGGGVLRTCHAVPFHCSARVNSVGFFGVPSLPTAMQFDRLVQDTPFRLAPELASAGVAISDHLLPFQDSAKGCGTRYPPGTWKTWVSPTAMQLVLLVHDTEFSCAPPPGSVGDGLGMIVQVLPFHV